MNEPKKPNYSNEEIIIMNKKLQEYKDLQNNEEKKKKYINEKISSKVKNRIILKGAIDGLIYSLMIIIFVFYMYFELFIENDLQKMTTTEVIVAICFFGFIGFGITMFFSIVLLGPILSFVYKILNPLFKIIDEEKNELSDEYQTNIAKDYNKYLLMKNEIDKYEKKLREYNEYCRKQSIDFWYSLDGHQFEQEIANLFRKEGYTANVSKVGADGGIDIILKKNDKRYAVQCKAHNKKISESVARDLYGVLHSRNFDGGYLITLNGTSSKTKEFCRNNRDKPIIIWTINDILKHTK